MATIPCPSCGLPRADDLFGTIPCPLCGHAGVLPPAGTDDGEPDSDLPWVIPEDPARSFSPRVDDRPAGRTASFPSKRSPGPGVLVGFLFGIVVGVGGTVGWPTIREWVPSVGPSELAEASPPPPDHQPEAPPVPLESPVTPEAKPGSAPVAPIEPEPAVPGPGGPPPKAAVVIGPSPEPVPLNPFRPAAPRAEKLDRVEVYAPEIAPGATLVARGRVKRLVVKGLEAGAVLDCSDLEARQVVVIGKIDGGSRLTIRAPGGQVTFLSRVDGRAKVDVRAPGGVVVFENPTDATRAGSKIDGGAEVDVAAREVRFVGRIAGAGTRVSVTLTAGGAFSFAEIEGPARLKYGKADPADPAPTVVRGTVRGAAVVKAE